jgi:hypothetical protein
MIVMDGSSAFLSWLVAWWRENEQIPVIGYKNGTIRGAHKRSKSRLVRFRRSSLSLNSIKMAAFLDYLMFACTAGASIFSQKSSSKDTCALKNSAFVFVKPHANTKATQDMVREKLIAAGIEILSESDIAGSTIDEKKLIDQHYYAIASKATILPADKIPVPEDKFQETFGEKWSDVLKEGRGVNAMEACKKFGCTAEELDAAWQAAKVVKFGGGFYCGLVSVKDQTPLYVFNAFFMVMRSKFVGDVSIHCYEVQWDPKKLSWESFRGELLGPTDPKVSIC